MAYRYEIKSVNSAVVDVDVYESDIPSPMFKFTLKWDGCVHLHGPAANGDESDRDYMHFCDSLREMIEIFTECRKIGKEYFSNQTQKFWED